MLPVSEQSASKASQSKEVDVDWWSLMFLSVPGALHLEERHRVGNAFNFCRGGAVPPTCCRICQDLWITLRVFVNHIQDYLLWCKQSVSYVFFLWRPFLSTRSKCPTSTQRSFGVLFLFGSSSCAVGLPHLFLSCTVIYGTEANRL